MKRWMPVALAELGVHETPGPRSTARIIEYGRATDLMPNSEDIPWCSDFVNWVIAQAGGEPTRSAAARSWTTWGSALTAYPIYGAITVLSRGSNPAQGHVGFLIDGTDDEVWVLGGNQGDAVTVQAFPRSRVIAMRWPIQPSV